MKVLSFSSKLGIQLFQPVILCVFLNKQKSGAPHVMRMAFRVEVDIYTVLRLNGIWQMVNQPDSTGSEWYVWMAISAV